MTVAQHLVDLTVREFTAAILCFIPQRPQPFNRIVAPYGLKPYVVNGSSERLQQLGIIAYRGYGWSPVGPYMVRLQPNRQGKFGKLADGSEIKLLPMVFRPDRTFIIGEVYDLRELAQEAREYAASATSSE